MVSVVDWISSNRYFYIWITLKRKRGVSHGWHNKHVWFLLAIQILAYQAVVVFRLQVYSPNHINPDKTLLRSTFWQLSELARWGSNTRIIRQGVHLECTLQVKTISHPRWRKFRSFVLTCNLWCSDWCETTLNSPTTEGSSSPFSFLPRCSLKVLQKSVNPLNSGTSSSSLSYTCNFTFVSPAATRVFQL